jgi:hypothetical protein
MGLPMIALTIGQGVFSAVQKNKQAEAQEKLYRQNREAAGQAGADKMAAENLQFSNNLKTIAGQRLDANLEAMRKVAEVENSAAESGLAGASVDSQAAQYHIAALRQGTSFSEQVKQMTNNTRFTAKNVTAETESRINSVQRGVKANLFNEILYAAAPNIGDLIKSDPYAGAFKIKKKETTPKFEDTTNYDGWVD